jgi:hypothetical protein
MQLNILLFGLATAALALPSPRLAARSQIQSDGDAPDASIGTAAQIGTADADNRDFRRANPFPIGSIGTDDTAGDNRDWRRDDGDSVRITGDDTDSVRITRDDTDSVRITGTETSTSDRDA